MQSNANGELPAARGRFVGGSVFFLNTQEHNVFGAICMHLTAIGLSEVRIASKVGQQSAYSLTQK